MSGEAGKDEEEEEDGGWAQLEEDLRDKKGNYRLFDGESRTHGQDSVDCSEAYSVSLEYLGGLLVLTIQLLSCPSLNAARSGSRSSLLFERIKGLLKRMRMTRMSW